MTGLGERNPAITAVNRSTFIIVLVILFIFTVVYARFKIVYDRVSTNYTAAHLQIETNRRISIENQKNIKELCKLREE